MRQRYLSSGIVCSLHLSSREAGYGSYDPHVNVIEAAIASGDSPCWNSKLDYRASLPVLPIVPFSFCVPFSMDVEIIILILSSCGSC